MDTVHNVLVYLLFTGETAKHFIGMNHEEAKKNALGFKSLIFNLNLLMVAF